VQVGVAVRADASSTTPGKIACVIIVAICQIFSFVVVAELLL
jgi:hypothetical protein